jgi:hypothetical protein
MQRQGYLWTIALILITSQRVAAAPFADLQPGFTQEIYGIATSFIGGIAFAPNGDVWVDPCADGSPLTRFDHQTTIVVNGTTIHPQVAGSPFPSDAGCGLTNHPNGTLYSNTIRGVSNLDASTGAELQPPFGIAGNVLGICVDPDTGNVVYVAGNGSIAFVSSDFTTQGALPTVATGGLVDGIMFDPTGDFLFLAVRASSPLPARLSILNRDGSSVQDVPIAAVPNALAFHSTDAKFVVTNNADGTMTRLDFPDDDFQREPVPSVFASGGFRGDLMQVGADGCLYASQNGTHFDDGTTSTVDNSVVRICGGFSASGAGPTCVGDCNHDREVTVDEILTMVNIALGNSPLSECTAADADGDGQVAVNEILSAVNAALNGCPQF